MENQNLHAARTLLIENEMASISSLGNSSCLADYSQVYAAGDPHHALDLTEMQTDCVSGAVEFRDADAINQSRRVGSIASLIAEHLGLAARNVEMIRYAASLHSVGKIGVADPLLRKACQLKPTDMEIAKSRCQVDEQVLAGSRAKLAQMAKRIALYHHEHWDGTGYPTGIKGEEIPLEARILAVADVFVALTQQRPYKQAWPLEQALEEIEYQSGRQFDPAVVSAFLDLAHKNAV